VENYEAYKEIIVGLLKAKALEWELHREVLDFIMSNLDELLRDIDNYLLKRGRRIPRSPFTTTLDKWLHREH